jgi:uncharacterized protein YabN with tetrapyrrole methylase and pyrophosphatase domain
MAGQENFSPDADGLMAVLKRLRGPDGCPWDKAQTRHTLTAHLAGECAELIDVVDREDAAGICDETGDVLMNHFLQVAIAEEKLTLAKTPSFSLPPVSAARVRKRIK